MNEMNGNLHTLELVKCVCNDILEGDIGYSQIVSVVRLSWQISAGQDIYNNAYCDIRFQ